MVALAIEGFWAAEVKLLGKPDQLYVAPATVEAVRLKVLPAQIGPLLPVAGAAGIALTVATVVAEVEVQPLRVSVTP